MRQVTYNKYGEAKNLQIIEVSKPVISKKGEILVKLEYSSLNAIDWKNRKGDFRLVSGLYRPRTKQGFDICGIVVDKASDINEFEINDTVVGQLGNMIGGALSEYVILKKNQIVKVLAELSKEQLGGLAMAGTTAWQALFVNAKLKKGDKVLINGGSSGVGHLAIQIAKAYGAVVTSVSSSRNIDFCKSIGADYTIDYSKTDFSKTNEKYDIIFDVVFNSSLSKVKSILTEQGVYIGTTPTPRMIFNMITNKHAQLVAVKPNVKALTDLVRLMREQRLEVKIDKIYKMSEIVEAHEDIEKSRTRGKLIIQINE